MITEDKITEIFCLADDFCKYFSSDAEVITILILFHSKGFRCLRHFYTQYVCKHLLHLFPKAV